MKDIMARIGVALAANAIALALAAILLSGMRVSFFFFFFLVILFSVVSLIVGPAVRALVQQHASSISPLGGLIATFITLLITDIASRSLSINGIRTWILATIIVWGAQLAVEYLAPRVLDDTLGNDSQAA